MKKAVRKPNPVAKSLRLKRQQVVPDKRRLQKHRRYRGEKE